MVKSATPILPPGFSSAYARSSTGSQVGIMVSEYENVMQIHRAAFGLVRGRVGLHGEDVGPAVALRMRSPAVRSSEGHRSTMWRL